MTDMRVCEGEKTAQGRGERQVKGQTIPEIIFNQHYNTETIGKDKQSFSNRDMQNEIFQSSSLVTD